MHLNYKTINNKSLTIEIAVSTNINTMQNHHILLILLSSVIIKQVLSSPWSQGISTRYWDCCKPSCGWWGKAHFKQPVLSCDINSNPVSYPTPSGCLEGGKAFTCPNQQPFIVSKNMTYGFAAVNLKDKTEKDWCCRCYLLRFQHPLLINKQMIVQATNTGWDLASNQFDIAIPGGGQGIFKGCAKQYKNYIGGNDYGGVSTAKECWRLPKHLVKGCFWRFEWFMNADNPKVLFKEVACPAMLTNITKCMRVNS